MAQKRKKRGWENNGQGPLLLPNTIQRRSNISSQNVTVVEQQRTRLNATKHKVCSWVLDPWYFFHSTKDIIGTTDEIKLMLNSSCVSHVRMWKLCLLPSDKKTLTKQFLDPSKNSGCKISCYSKNRIHSDCIKLQE